MCIDRDIELLPGPVPSHDTVALLAFEGLPRLFLAFRRKQPLVDPLKAESIHISAEPEWYQK